MKYLLILTTIFLMSCKKDNDYSLKFVSTGKSDLYITTYYDYKDLKANGSFKFKHNVALTPYRESQEYYINPDYAYRIELKGADTCEYFIYKNSGLIKHHNGDYSLIIDKGKIK